MFAVSFESDIETIYREKGKPNTYCNNNRRQSRYQIFFCGDANKMS